MSLFKQYLDMEERRLRKLEQINNRRLMALCVMITEILDEQATHNVIVQNLIQYGNLTITGFGCLCGKGHCRWQEGLADLLSEYIESWRERQVIISFTGEGIYFKLDVTMSIFKEPVIHCRDI